MKKMLIALFIFMTVGCSSPGKPGLFYEWTQYKTGVKVEVVSMPKWKGGVDAILRCKMRVNMHRWLFIMVETSKATLVT